MNANGRVNILNQPTGGVFNLYDRIPVEQMTSYREALTGNFENNLLSRAFFSAKNITALQYQIINGVAKSSNGAGCTAVKNVPGDTGFCCTSAMVFTIYICLFSCFLLSLLFKHIYTHTHTHSVYLDLSI